MYQAVSPAQSTSMYQAAPSQPTAVYQAAAPPPTAMYQAPPPQQTAMYQAPPPQPTHGYQALHAGPPPSHPVGPPAQAVPQGEPFPRLRNAPMFRLSSGSDTPIHSNSITENSYKITKHMTVYRSVITRWAVPHGAPNSIVVDVYQIRNPFSMGASPFMVVSSQDAFLRLAGKFDIRIKRGKVWTKHWTRQAIEEVVVVAEGGAAAPLQMVERQEEKVAPEEGENVKSRFRRWQVPA